MTNVHAVIAGTVSAALVLGLIFGLLLALLCRVQRRRWGRRKVAQYSHSLCTIHITEADGFGGLFSKPQQGPKQPAGNGRIPARRGKSIQLPAFSIHADASGPGGINTRPAAPADKRRSPDGGAFGAAVALHRSIVRASLRSALSAPEELPSFVRPASAPGSRAGSKGGSPRKPAFLTRLASGSWAGLGGTSGGGGRAIHEYGPLSARSDNASETRAMSLAGEVRLEEVCLAERIGQGASSTVYRGAWRGAPCAVKFMICDTADEKAWQRATREIVLSKRLSHPHVVADTPRAQRVLSYSSMAPFAPAMTPIADDGGTTARPTPAVTPQSAPGEACREQSGAAASAAEAHILGFQAVLGSTPQHGASSGGAPLGDARRAEQATAAAAAGADVNLLPSPAASAASGATFESALAPGDDGSSCSGGGDTLGSAHTTAPVVPEQLQTASVPPGEHGVARGGAAAALPASTHPVAAASTGPARGRRRPVRRVLTFTEADAAAGPPLSFKHPESGLLPASAPLPMGAWANNPLAGALRQDAEVADAAPGVITSAAAAAVAARQSAQAAHSMTLPAAWQDAGTVATGDENSAPTVLQGGLLQTEEPTSRLATPQPGHNVWDGVVAASTGRRDSMQMSRIQAAADVPSLLGGPAVSSRYATHGATGGVHHNELFEPDPTAAGQADRPPASPSAAAAQPAGTLSPMAAFWAAMPPPVWGAPKPPPAADEDALPPPAPTAMPVQPASTLDNAAVAPSPDSFNSEQGFGSPMRCHNAYGYRHGNAAAEVAGLHGSQAVLVTVMEFCDLGTLSHAIRRNAFQPKVGGRWSFDHTYRALLRTAAEVAKALDFMHGLGVVHGDLKPANVLLKTHRADRRGYVAKVADFGLSRQLAGGEACTEAGAALGTVPYTAPEVFDSGTPTQASDVYAFGILLWEMWHGRRAHEGLLEAQIAAAVCCEGARPEWDAAAPPPLTALASVCWAPHPADRPAFQEVARRLTHIEEDFRSAWHRNGQLRAQAAAEFFGITFQEAFA